MALLQGLATAISAVRLGLTSSASSPSSSKGVSFVFPPSTCRRVLGDGEIRRRLRVRAMVQQAVQGTPAAYAKEMERLSAKESLLLAFKDAGGFEALVSGKTTDVQQIDVNERITGLERLNPTPRPTTSPYLEGRWNFEWFGSGSPGLFAAKFIFERFPATLVNLSKMEIFIKDGTTKTTAHVKLLNSIETKFILSTKLSVEGPLRMKEEYVVGVIESPTIIEETVPDQLRGVFNQAASTVKQLPVPIRDTIASGLRIPLNGTYQRLFMISYLDEEILIIRDTAGIPEVLTRIETPLSPIAEQELEPISEYES